MIAPVEQGARGELGFLQKVGEERRHASIYDQKKPRGYFVPFIVRVMAGPAEGRVPAIHVFGALQDCKNVDGRDKPGHDAKCAARYERARQLLRARGPISAACREPTRTARRKSPRLLRR